MPYWYLQERLTGRAISQDYRTEAEAIQAQGHSELLDVRADSGKLHGMAFGFGPNERPKLGQRRVDPAWTAYVRGQLGRLEREYYGDV